MKAIRTIMHCHTRGLHSILLHENPIVRLFIADPRHDLHTNGLGPGVGVERFAGQSVAFHRHRYDLDLHHVSGVVWNVYGALLPAVGGSEFIRCEYRSKLVDGEAGLLDTGKRRRVATDYQRLEPGDPHLMAAGLLHTVAVPERERAAWIVRERPVDPPLDMSVYTTNPVFDASGLYVDATGWEDAVAELIAECDRDLGGRNGFDLVAEVLEQALAVP